MRKSTKKDFVNKMLDQVFNTVKHTDQVEREVGNVTEFYIISKFDFTAQEVLLNFPLLSWKQMASVNCFYFLAE